MVRVRFAPSPTGHLHIGNARTALFNWLFARHEAGAFLLRIEDTDVIRSTSESEKAILDDLKWLGLEWDEGPNKKGPYGPYRQSERMEIYTEFAKKLLNEGKAYLCFCTPDELEREKKLLMSKGKMPLYTGRCRNLTNKEQAMFEREGRRPVIRFRSPQKAILVSDLVRGEVTFEPQYLGDIVLIRSNGKAAYNFAVVIDDALMQITHILRGEDHLSNTPKQILLYEALGFPKPKFGHMSMILGPDHSRLSKRHGATSVEQFRHMGILPGALINYLALLGWSAEKGQDTLSVAELISQFSLDRLAKSSAVFDFKKLLWLNGYHIRSKDPADLSIISRAFLPKERGWDRQIEDIGEDWWSLVIDSVKTKLETLRQVPDWVYVYFEHKSPLDDEAKSILEGPSSKSTIQAALDEFEALSPGDLCQEEALKRILKAISHKSGIKGKPLYMTLRVALTGSTRGPEMDRLIPLLGKQKVIERLRRALLWV